MSALVFQDLSVHGILFDRVMFAPTSGREPSLTRLEIGFRGSVSALASVIGVFALDGIRLGREPEGNSVFQTEADRDGDLAEVEKKQVVLSAERTPYATYFLTKLINLAIPPGEWDTTLECDCSDLALEFITFGTADYITIPELTVSLVNIVDDVTTENFRGLRYCTTLDDLLRNLSSYN